MSDYPPRNVADDGEIDLVQLFSLFYARKFTILAITFLGTLIGIGFALTSTPIYQADALIQLEEKSNGTSALASELTEMFRSTAPQSVAEIEILKSRMILGVVVKDLNLTQTALPKRLPIIGDFLTRYILPDPGWSFLSTYAWHSESIVLGQLNMPAHLLGEPVVLTNLGEGKFSVNLGFGVVLIGQVGEVLRDNTAGFVLLVDRLTGSVGREFIIREHASIDVINGLRANFSISEKGKNSSILRLTLKDVHPVESTRILAQIIKVYLLQNLSRSVAEAESSIAFIQQQLPEAQALVANAEMALNAFKLSQTSIDLSFETRSLLEQAVQIKAQLNTLILEEQELQKRFTPSHPIYQTLLDNRSQLKNVLAEIHAQTIDLPETQQEILRLSEDLQVAQGIYLQLVSRAQELNIIKAGTISNIRIIDTAQAQAIPVAPNKNITVLLSMVLSGMAAIGFVLLRSLVARGVQSIEDIEQLGIPVYATVNKFGGGLYNGKIKNDTYKILAKEEPTSMTVEALRNLRTSLHFGMIDAKSSLLALTSARPGEGKSFMSVNLATLMAQAGQNICLMDLDLRRGYLRRFFGVEKTALGLTDVLAGDTLIEDVITKDDDTGLYFIPSGRYPPNPSELLMGKVFSEVMEYLDKRFDLTILDTPPILAVTDPIIICKYTGMVLLVIKHENCSLAEIKAVQKTLDANALKVTGSVLNQYNPKKIPYGYKALSYQYDYKSR